ncbi:hypothetical protein BpHYR1_001673 [Brachionus plicatilis]|uniref:Uncharacterized protein n=1 Tax=Brachionus plicatilis TaxID=10195 RepID=A0A3M7P9Y1_BRAPC|nr:hypothetical protein BpHYR1_001673 [Brachionus plicatilis]
MVWEEKNFNFNFLFTIKIYVLKNFLRKDEKNSLNIMYNNGFITPPRYTIIRIPKRSLLFETSIVVTKHIETI